MTDQERQNMIKRSWEMHAIVEQHYIDHAASKGDKAWAEKQRLLLADMAIHLLQTAIQPGDIELEKLQNNLHAIMTISDLFLPNAELKAATQSLYR